MGAACGGAWPATDAITARHMGCMRVLHCAKNVSAPNTIQTRKKVCFQDDRDTHPPCVALTAFATGGSVVSCRMRTSWAY